MRHHIFEKSDAFVVAILIKGSAFNKQDILVNYVEPLFNKGIKQSEIIAFTLSYNQANKAPAKHIKDYLDNLLPALHSLHVKYLYVADSGYFKTLTGKPKAEPHVGYVLPCKIKGYEHMQVVLGINHQQLIYNPALASKMDSTLSTVAAAYHETYQPPGLGIIHHAHYPKSLEAIQVALNDLHRHSALSCDIEGFSLRFDEAGIGTIAFAWDEHNGVAFACDYRPIWDEAGCYDPNCNVDVAAYEGYYSPSYEVRKMLLEFFTTYKGELTFHNAPYDVKAIIYSLWMDSYLDGDGLLNGLDIMTKNMHDTKIIAYLATNSTAGNVLGLKALAHEYAGNWAVEVKDIRKVKLDDLLQYNLVDALCTNYTKESTGL